jgi:hypothetical protein
MSSAFFSIFCEVMSADAGQPLTLTTDAQLDVALRLGWERWEAAAANTGADGVAGWLAHRLGDPEMKRELLDPVRGLLSATDPDERALSRAELAELLEGEDDFVSDTLWEGVLAYGRDADDAEVIFDATTHLATIAEEHGDPLAAAEYYLDFLNWRRQPGHGSDPEAVETAFEEVIRLALLDGEQSAPALFEYRQAAFTRLLDADDERATEGDWERDPAPYTSWA